MQTLKMRYATNNTKLETSNCNNCKKQHYMNIGSLNCYMCGNKK